MNLNSSPYGNSSAYASHSSHLNPASLSTMYGSNNSTNAAAATGAHVGGSTQPQSTNPTYNSYAGAPGSNTNISAGAAASGIFYSNSTMTGSGGAPTMYTAHPAAQAAMFQMSPNASSQVFAPQQQPQPVSAMAAAAAYNNAATNIHLGSKLFVGQVPAVCTEEQLRPLFAQFGRLLEIKIMREPNGRSRGSAWVRYEAEESARNAIAALNERHVVPPQTNPLRVQFAAPRQPRTQVVPMSASLNGLLASPAQQAQAPPAQPQANYTATYAPTYATAGPTAYLPQGPYTAASGVLSYGGNDAPFAVRTPPQGQLNASAQQPPQGKMEYLRSDPTGAGVMYTSSVPPRQDLSPQPQPQTQPQHPQPQQASSPQQLVYTTGGQMRTNVLYATEGGFAMAHPQQQQQQQQQWRN